MSHLRRIALTVEQDDPGHFHWVIIESTGDMVVYEKEVFHCHEETYASYEKAWRAGLAGLIRHFGADLLHGPQTDGEDEGGHPVSVQDVEADDAVWSPS